MSVFIKGFDKPKNCRVCDFNSSDCFCKINHGKIDRDFWDCDKECPIIEVPTPHGDLIDRDALNIGEYEREDDDSVTLEISLGGLLSLYHKVIDAPTVIGAEGTE